MEEHRHYLDILKQHDPEAYVMTKELLEKLANIKWLFLNKSMDSISGSLVTQTLHERIKELDMAPNSRGFIFLFIINADYCDCNLFLEHVWDRPRIYPCSQPQPTPASTSGQSHGPGDATCMLWGVETGSKVTEFADHLGDVMSISINPTNQHVSISEACDAFAKLWDIHTGKAVQTFAGHESDIIGVLHDWDVETGSMVSEWSQR